MTKQKNSNPKQITVHVVTKPDEELEFDVHRSIRGQELFDLVCRAIGLREHYYFGLFYERPDQQPSWVRMNKKLKYDLGEHMSTTKLYLRVEFYPIDVESGIILELTTHLFFLHIKSEILSENIYCPAEEAILLASYAVQAKYGDFDSDIHKKHFLSNEQLLPHRVLSQFKLSSEQWEEKIVQWYLRHCQGLSRFQAEMEYLKTAQNLDMYGIGYYRIQNQLETELWLGIHATGINVYESDNKLIPKVSFLWSEIKNISFKNKQIWIQPMEKDVNSFHFISLDVSINRKILLLCSGNHDLYMKSKKPDSLEIQIMKSQAQEAREERTREQNRLDKEIHKRMEETQARIDMQRRLEEYSKLIDEYRSHLEKAEETTDLLAEKALVAEEEARLLLKKAADFEDEIKSLQQACNQKDEERSALESHMQNAEVNFHQIMQESDRRARETMMLKQELDQSRKSEKMATEKLMELTSNHHLITYPAIPSTSYSPGNTTYSTSNTNHSSGNNTFSYLSTQTTSHSYPQPPPPQPQPVQINMPSNGFGTQSMAAASNGYWGQENIARNFQQERSNYILESEDLRRQLTELKTEIEGYKISNKTDMLDRIHFESVGRGETKNSTLQKLQASSTNARVKVYQEL